MPLTIEQRALLAAATDRMRELQLIFDAMVDPELSTCDMGAFGPVPTITEEKRPI
jgi:hypothetical protein